MRKWAIEIAGLQKRTGRGTTSSIGSGIDDDEIMKAKEAKRRRSRRRCTPTQHHLLSATLHAVHHSNRNRSQPASHLQPAAMNYHSPPMPRNWNWMIAPRFYDRDYSYLLCSWFWRQWWRFKMKCYIVAGIGAVGGARVIVERSVFKKGRENGQTGAPHLYMGIHNSERKREKVRWRERARQRNFEWPSQTGAPRRRLST